jgi:predicted DCC family thiol-disulfide oxidoreductase YuxK
MTETIRPLMLRPLMLYDGLCGMCNSAVQWVIRHDRHDQFRFAPQQSGLAAEILGRQGVDRDAGLAGNSVYLVMDPGTPRERLLRESDVAINILTTLGGGWRVLGRLLRAVPAFLRNAGYRFFARNRYRFGGRYSSCPLPSAADRMKFVG